MIKLPFSLIILLNCHLLRAQLLQRQFYRLYLLHHLMYRMKELTQQWGNLLPFQQARYYSHLPPVILTSPLSQCQITTKYVYL